MSDRITIRISPDIREALDRYRSEQEPRMASKQDCYRRIIEDWLIGHGYLPLPPDREDAN